MSWKAMSAAAALGLLVASGGGAMASGDFAIELNDAADLDAGCRLIYVAVNETGQVVDKASYDVFIFDAGGRVTRSLLFQYGNFPVGKTKVVQFDLQDQACGDISRLLVNDMRDCQVAGAPSTLCLDALKTTSRTPIVFGL